VVTFPIGGTPQLAPASLTSYTVLPSGPVNLYTQGETFTFPVAPLFPLTLSLVYTPSALGGLPTTLSTATVAAGALFITLPPSSIVPVNGPGTVALFATFPSTEGTTTLFGQLPITASSTVSTIVGVNNNSNINGNNFNNNNNNCFGSFGAFGTNNSFGRNRRCRC
jgi:hypothetical protein